MSTSPKFHSRSMTADDFDALAALEQSAASDAWNKTLFESRLADPRTQGHIIESNGAIAGYLVYERDENHHQNSIVKFAVTTGHESQAIEIQNMMLDMVKDDMSPEGRAHIVVYTSSEDKPLVDFFSRPDQHFRSHKAAGSDHMMLVYDMPQQHDKGTAPDHTSQSANGDVQAALTEQEMLGFTSYASTTPLEDEPSKLVWPEHLKHLGESLIAGAGIDEATQTPITFDPIDVGGVQFISSTQDIHEDDEILYPPNAYEDDMSTEHSHKTITKQDICRQAKAHLTGLTNMEWEIVGLSTDGHLEKVALTPNTDMSDVYLQTANKVSSVKNAMGDLCSFLGHETAASSSAKLDAPGHVTIPSSWVQPKHLQKGIPGHLSESFKPAATQWRYQCHEEQQEKRNHGNQR